MSYSPLSLKLTVSVVLIWLSTSVSSTFSPSGSVSIDCGGQQTFTCTVAANGPAVWTIAGLQGITASWTNGVLTANNNARITSAEAVVGLTSTITIAGFTTADNGGIVQCVDQAAAVEGNATVVVGPPQCGQVGVVIGNDSCPSFTFGTPQGSVLPSTVMVSYQLVADPSSAGSLNCAYPVDPQMCELVVPGGTYTVRATPQNNCGSPSSTCSSHTVLVPANCTLANRLPTTTAPAPTVCILSGVIPSVVLILINIISVVVVFLVTRHCYKKSVKGGSSSRREELYEQVEGKKVCEDINMTDSPAYGPTSTQNK